MTDWIVALAGPTGGIAVAAMVISYVRWSCKRDDAREPLDNETRHLSHELVDVRSDVFAPNELVATLCVTCDKQFPPRLWESKISAELAELEKPKTDTAYVTVEPMITNFAGEIVKHTTDAILDYQKKFLLGPDPEPTSSWTYQRFRQYGWYIEDIRDMNLGDGPGGLVSVVLAKADKRFMFPMSRGHYVEWHSR
jgi:hypothetical protein